MIESNFSLPSQNKSCVCISSALYDRRAIDAPSPSLPLVNSLTHLSYLTATSPRIREILSLDGGLERLVKILKNCAAAPPKLIEENLIELKGKGTNLIKGARKSPFKPFASYLSPTSDSNSNDPKSILNENSSKPNSSSSTNKSMTTQSKHLLYTYTLAFQCLVNIGVRGSEHIRTRVVEAGALEVVIHVLERYLESIEKKKKNQLIEIESNNLLDENNTRRSSLPVTRPLLEQLQQTTNAAEAAAALANNSTTTTAATITTTIQRINNNRNNGLLLPPPTRVSTPDTIISMEDDIAESSGQEADGDVDGDGTECDEINSTSGSSEINSTITEEERRIRGKGREEIIDDDSNVGDQDGDVRMDGPDEHQHQQRQQEQEELEINTATPRSTTNNNSIPSANSATTPTASTSTSTNEEGLQYRDEDVLLSLQLLAYLSKYPHVRSVFHSPTEVSDATHICGTTCTHNRFDLPTLPLPRRRDQSSFSNNSIPSSNPTTSLPLPFSRNSNSQSQSSFSTSSPSPSTSSKQTSPTLSSNVFSLVEAFTHRPPSSDHSTPRHSNEVQYWAGVIMRNACRKDETRKGIRQCANMQCGQWEKNPREFAKCRRCRKAKYCSKSCQSISWSSGHKFWCTKTTSSVRETGGERNVEDSARNNVATTNNVPLAATTTIATLGGPPAATRRSLSHRDHHHHHNHSRHSTTNPSNPSTTNFEDEEDEEDEFDSNQGHQQNHQQHQHQRMRLPSVVLNENGNVINQNQNNNLIDTFNDVRINTVGGGVEGGMIMMEVDDQNDITLGMIGR